jgi:hypothetical protein
MRCVRAVLACAPFLLAGCAARATVAVEPEVAIVQSSSAHVPTGNHVWVCHRGRWQEVATPAAEAHRRHGDRVSSAAHEARGGC